MFRPELVDLTRFPSAQAAGARALAVLERLVVERTEGTRATPAKRETMVSMHWAMVHGLSSLLLDGSLGNKHPVATERSKHVEQVLELFSQGVG
jgi:hypothetical protein